jgi:hypothetical protein
MFYTGKNESETFLKVKLFKNFSSFASQEDTHPDSYAGEGLGKEHPASYSASSPPALDPSVVTRQKKCWQ